MFQFPGFALIPLFYSENKYLHIQPVTAEQPCRLPVDNGSQKMGCPIRKFSDQSLFAAPRNLSQRTTSFIASQRQGIRRIPFRHLIVLEIRKRTTQGQPCRASLELRSSPRQTRLNPLPDRKDQFCFKHIREPAVRRGSRLVCYQTTDRQFGIELAPNPASSVSSPKPDALPLHDVMERTTPRRI